MIQQPPTTLERFLAGQGYIRIPLITNNTGHFEVLVQLKQRQWSFIVDTGASVTVIDNQYALLVPLVGELSNDKAAGMGTAEQDTFEVDDVLLQIDQFKVHLPKIFITDLSHVNNALKSKGSRPIAGVLGGDVLLHSSAIIDYKGGAMFLKPTS
jgi:hypothetical protein